MATVQFKDNLSNKKINNTIRYDILYSNSDHLRLHTDRQCHAWRLFIVAHTWKAMPVCFLFTVTMRCYFEQYSGYSDTQVQFIDALHQN